MIRLLAHFESRKMAALFCLLAMLFFQAPAFAGFVIATGACCTGEQCPIHGHHQKAKQAETGSTDCDHEHHSSGGVQSCSISCCHDAPSAALHAQHFVPPISSTNATLGLVSQASVLNMSAPLAPALAPSPPPPRSFSL
jgi:hypothetical protein